MYNWAGGSKKIHAKLVDLLDKTLTNPDFINTHKTSPTDFSRNRSFSFKSLSLFIISSVQSSLQRELDRFFKSYNNTELSERFVTQSAFSQARVKIQPSAFLALNKKIVEYFYSNYCYKKWYNMRLVAIDGSIYKLPKTKNVIKKYGEYTTNIMDESVIISRVSKAYDVLNNISIDTRIENTEIGEHKLAKEHLKNLRKSDLLLFDRGYPSFDLFREILANGCHFCVRVPVSNWRASMDLVKSNKNEIVAQIKPGYEIRAKYKAKQIEYEPIKCRFILIELPSGEKEVLVTSLLDERKYPHHVFKDLYHLRWGVEESFKKDKIVIQIENFTGKSTIAIEQDLYAGIILGNITSVLGSNLDKHINNSSNQRKHRYQLNIKTALAKVKESLALLFTNSKKNVIRLLGSLIDIFLSNILPVRDNRNFYRVEKRKRRRQFHPFKSM